MSSSQVDPSGEPGAARQRRARDAAAGASDLDRLLPGEDPERADAHDAAQWVEVYAELLLFKQEMLQVLSARTEKMKFDRARQEVEETDAVVLRAEAERLARRLGYWRRRLDELS
ncbi:MAG: hypothetical protein J2P45_00360 [Candidatus Dormibacteraeota bacterium]|nr:hypothetical protein [Candidatus Dormibacteraeota bacterium]